MTGIDSWKKYNNDLRNRGNFNFIIDPDIFLKSRSTGRGKPYNIDFISAILIIRTILNLPYRQLEGHMHYLASLMKIKIDIPHYSTFSKRYKDIEIKQCNEYKNTIFEYKDIVGVVDATGFTISHKGEYLSSKSYPKNNDDNENNNKKPNKYRDSKAKFVKYHAYIDQDSGLCMSHIVTEASGENTHDTTQYKPLLDKGAPYHSQIVRNTADKAYDSEANYKATEAMGAKLICPIKSNVKNVDIDNFQRQIVKIYRDNNDMNFWSKSHGYNFRGLIEAFFSRFKRMFTSRVKSRKMINIKQELALKTYIINKITMREISILRVPCNAKTIRELTLAA
jgi:hypothetical protein